MSKLSMCACFQPFGQAPLLKDGDEEFAQSNAILRHLGRKHGLSENSYTCK